MHFTCSALTHVARRLLGLTLTAGLVLAPLPALAGPPAESGETAESSAPAQVGGNVAVLKFSGDATEAEDWRTRVQTSLSDRGYQANMIKRSLEEAAEKNKCRTIDDACLERIGAYINKNSRTAYDFYIYGEVPTSGPGQIVVYDVANKARVVELSFNRSALDYVLVETVAPAVAARLANHQAPPAPVTPEEQAVLDSLDEPERTPEELAQEEEALRKAEEEAVAAFKAGVDVGEQTVDLRGDFEQFCRKGPREDKETEQDDGTVTKERDLRPVCKRGPVFGYWQPRAWVALSLTIGAGVSMGIMYGLAAAARSDWRQATDRLESSGLSGDDPNQACDGDTCYADLAADISVATGQIRRRAIVGDVMLGATVLLAGVLAIIIYQDRQAAKGYIKNEKELRALSNLRIGPMLGEASGAALGFEF